MTPPRFIPATIRPAEAADPDQRPYWDGLPVSGRITSPYAAYEPYREAQGWGSHNGVDIARPDICGAEILAAYPGTVHFTFGDGVGGTEEGSLGTFVVLRHEHDGQVWFTAYAHLLMQAAVVVGDVVAQGQMIGLVGYSGAVNPPGPNGAHLHFIVMEGVGYANRTADTFFDPALLTGASLLPMTIPVSYPVPDVQWVPQGWGAVGNGGIADDPANYPDVPWAHTYRMRAKTVKPCALINLHRDGRTADGWEEFTLYIQDYEGN